MSKKNNGWDDGYKFGQSMAKIRYQVPIWFQIAIFLLGVIIGAVVYHNIIIFSQPIQDDNWNYYWDCEKWEEIDKVFYNVTCWNTFLFTSWEHKQFEFESLEDAVNFRDKDWMMYIYTYCEGSEKIIPYIKTIDGECIKEKWTRELV